jgi:hypothetical protein
MVPIALEQAPVGSDPPPLGRLARGTEQSLGPGQPAVADRDVTDERHVEV